MSISDLDATASFQNLILKLQSFWASKGCTLLQPFDMEMGAGTFHPATFLPMSNLHAVQPMVVMVKTQTALGITTNFKYY